MDSSWSAIELATWSDASELGSGQNAGLTERFFISVIDLVLG